MDLAHGVARARCTSGARDSHLMRGRRRRVRHSRSAVLGFSLARAARAWSGAQPVCS